MRFLPASYGWLMRRKIARLYGELNSWRTRSQAAVDRPILFS